MIKFTNMTKTKCPKYLCFWGCNVEDVKVIDWICTKSKLIIKVADMLIGNQNNTTTNQETKTTLQQDGKWN